MGDIGINKKKVGGGGGGVGWKTNITCCRNI